MGATAIFRGALPRFVRRRPVHRLSVLAWALAAAALLSIAISLFLGRGNGAFALVQAGSMAEAAAPTSTPAPKVNAAPDPTQFRRAAPPPDGRPRVAVIVRGLGLSRTLTADAIAKLPPDLSLGLSPYSREAQKIADAARGAGHEIFLDVPVEPDGYPANDAGPKALLSALPADQNQQRLTWSMGRMTGYAGLVFAATAKPLDSKDLMGPLLTDPATHGLVWAHFQSHGFDGAQISGVEVSLIADAAPDARAIDAALDRLEALARQNGSALAMANAYPVTIARLTEWAAHLEDHGIALVPASALAATPGA